MALWHIFDAKFCFPSDSSLQSFLLRESKQELKQILSPHKLSKAKRKIAHASTHAIYIHTKRSTCKCAHICAHHTYMHTQGRTFLTSLLVCFHLCLLSCSLGTPDRGTVPSTIGQVYWHPQIKDKVLQDRHTVHLDINNLSLTLFLNDFRMCSFQQQHPKQLDRFLLKLYT